MVGGGGWCGGVVAHLTCIGPHTIDISVWGDNSLALAVIGYSVQSSRYLITA